MRCVPKEPSRTVTDKAWARYAFVWRGRDDPNNDRSVGQRVGAAAMRCYHTSAFGRLAQLVERYVHTVEVIGSRPVSPTKTAAVCCGYDACAARTWVARSARARATRDRTVPTGQPIASAASS